MRSEAQGIAFIYFQNSWPLYNFDMAVEFKPLPLCSCWKEFQGLLIFDPLVPFPLPTSPTPLLCKAPMLCAAAATLADSAGCPAERASLVPDGVLILKDVDLSATPPWILDEMLPSTLAEPDCEDELCVEAPSALQVPDREDKL